MGYIYIQSENNNQISMGPFEGESINQSYYFNRNFQLNAVNVLFGEVPVDSINDLKIKCEVRKSYGSNKLLNPDSEIIQYSPWYNEENIISHTYNQFAFDREELEYGTYYFCFVSNIRINDPIYFSLQDTGSFNGNFLKIINGSGIYLSTQSLVFKVDGVWIGEYPSNKITIEDAYMSTTIRDES